MIEILTVFLGLYHGLQTVELEVAPVREHEVAVVELWLDGEVAGTLSRPPWQSRVDLGPVLEPHELVVVARDAQGGELGHARRWINREFEPPKEDENGTAIVLSVGRGVRLPPVAQMQSWFSADGEALEVMRVEQRAAEVVIVRDPATQPFLERTASFFFQLRLECHLKWDDATLTDKQVFAAAARRELLRHGNHESATQAEAVWEQWNGAFSFGDDAGIRFISPRAVPASRVARRHGIFNLTKERPSNERGLLWHSAVVRPLQFRPRISDAVAMAGLEAHAGRRRRAVVLMMKDEAMGPSRYPPAAVRGYLEDLQVPLYVWGFGLVDPGMPAAEAADPSPQESPPPSAELLGPAHPDDGSVAIRYGLLETAGGWGEVRDLTHPSTLTVEAIEGWLGRVTAAADEVRRSLRRQRVVWLRGVHPPHRVELSRQPAGIRLAGSALPRVQERAD